MLAHKITQGRCCLTSAVLCIEQASAAILSITVHVAVQALLLDDTEKLSSMSLLAHMAPLSALMLMPLTAIYEPGSAAAARELVASSGAFAALLGANCALAFFVNLTNFLVTKVCGALSLQVLGNAKGVIAAIISVFIFHNPVSLLGWLGYGITMVGVVLYSESRKRKPHASPAVSPVEPIQPLLGGDAARSSSLQHGDMRKGGSVAAVERRDGASTSGWQPVRS
jgi:hypothetical protein